MIKEASKNLRGLNLIDYSINTIFNMHWETKKIPLAHFIAIFALLWWSRTKPTTSRISSIILYAPYDLIPKLKKHNQKTEDQHPL